LSYTTPFYSDLKGASSSLFGELLELIYLISLSSRPTEAVIPPGPIVNSGISVTLTLSRSYSMVGSQKLSSFSDDLLLRCLRSFLYFLVLPLFGLSGKSPPLVFKLAAGSMELMLT